MTDTTEFIQLGQDWIGGVPAAAGGSGDVRHTATSLTWMSRGACQGEDPDLFFPIATQGPAQSQISAARAVCRRCTVAAMCLTYALQTSQAGIWGGTTQEERHAIGERHRQRAGRQASRLTAQPAAASGPT